jgi:hypothetical protein
MENVSMFPVFVAIVFAFLFSVGQALPQLFGEVGRTTGEKQIPLAFCHRLLSVYQLFEFLAESFLRGITMSSSLRKHVRSQSSRRRCGILH